MDINLGEILSAFPNAGKDWQRIGLFLTATQKRAIELVMENGDYKGFLAETFEFAKEWVPKKPGWKDLGAILSGKYDPYGGKNGARQKAREFGKKWQLDAAFMEAMG